MGQNTSSSSGLEGDIANLHARLSAQFKVLNRLAFLKHDELLTIIKELNSIMTDCIDRNGRQLCFTVRKGSDSTIFWKTTIRIRCLKLNTNDNNIESSRLLTLRQFIILYKEIQDQVQVLDTGEANLAHGTDASNSQTKEQFTTSAYFSSPDLHEAEGECCVCMDRKACLMLSCSHEFCETCIDNWTKDRDHSTCPLCRSKVKGPDDQWVLADKNDDPNYQSEVKGYLTSLADREND